MLVFTVIPYFIDTLFTLSTFFFVRLKEYKIGDFNYINIYVMQFEFNSRRGIIWQRRR